MQTWSYGRGALGISLAGAILVGCGGAQSPIGVPLNSPSGFLTTQRTHQSVTYEVIHSFRPRYKGNMNDGRHPAAGLVDVNGTLYGTTFYGGTDGCGSGDRKPGCGTVYTITTSGAESVLYRFTGGVNGQNPNAGVVNAHGMLFGTTSNGGNYGFGTIFSVTPSGTQTVLHSFAGQPADGAHPTATLLDVNGTLYGGTSSGGTNSDGTVYSITGSGAETVLHSFTGKPKDGSGAVSSLVNFHGTLYGTTDGGGANDLGTVFSIAPSGAETVLYSFKGGTTDGQTPEGPLVKVRGLFYGTTLRGGANSSGTIFSITPSGTEKIIYNFKGRKNGAGPRDKLINIRGTLYGITQGSGAGKYGTVFSVTPSGTEIVLHRFAGSPEDGAFPEAPLLNVNGTLYGTTFVGGTYKEGAVFALTP